MKKCLAEIFFLLLIFSASPVVYSGFLPEEYEHFFSEQNETELLEGVSFVLFEQYASCPNREVLELHEAFCRFVFFQNLVVFYKIMRYEKNIHLPIRKLYKVDLYNAECDIYQMFGDYLLGEWRKLKNMRIAYYLYLKIGLEYFLKKEGLTKVILTSLVFVAYKLVGSDATSNAELSAKDFDQNFIPEKERFYCFNQLPAQVAWELGHMFMRLEKEPDFVVSQITWLIKMKKAKDQFWSL